MSAQGFTHLIGIWHPESLPRAQAELLTGDGQFTVLDDQRLRVQGFGKDAWGGLTHRNSSAGLHMVLGEPVLLEGDQPQPRERLLERLKSEPAAALLTQCQGSFCGLRWRADAELQVFTDALGLRPIWHVPLGAGLAFSSHLGALRNFLREDGQHPALDEQGFAESLAFGISLGNRSCWHGLRRLRHGELLQADAQGVRVRTYRRFDTEVDEKLDIEAATAGLDAVFERAVSDRLRLLPRAERPRAFLSGGMDSRLVVTKLIALSPQRPITLNVAPDGSLDAVLGNSVAAHLAVQAHHVPANGSLSEGQQLADRELQAAEPASARIWWSGDGGSVGLGHVYLSAASGDAASADPQVLAAALIADNRWRFSGSGLRAGVRQAWLRRPLLGVVEELEQLRAAGWPIQKCGFGFVLLNDQQRHLDSPFEELTHKPFDLSLPFFDARFIQQVLRTPTRHLLGHRLYNHWFATRLGEAGLHPWQCYPGHEPCPHPMPANLRDQWSGGWYDRGYLRRLQRAQARRVIGRLLRGALPAQLSTGRVALAAGLTWLGWRDMRYTLREAEALCAASDA